MCGKFNIQILYLIYKKGRIGANEEEGATCVMMGNHYLFTSFGKLVKECKKGLEFDWIWHILWFRSDIGLKMAENLTKGELKYILLWKLFIFPHTNGVFKVILGPSSSILNFLFYIKLKKTIMANLQLPHTFKFFIHSFCTQYFPILVIFEAKS